MQWQRVFRAPGRAVRFRGHDVPRMLGHGLGEVARTGPAGATEIPAQVGVLRAPAPLLRTSAPPRAGRFAMSEFESAARELGLENDPVIAALSRLLRTQDDERERAI